MGLDLTGVSRVVERLLDDEVQVWRDVEGRTDDILDETTGQLWSPCTDRELVWAGHGSVVPLGEPAVVEPLDAATAPVTPSTAYKALLPVDAPPSRPGDLLTVVHSVRDDQLAGRWFRVSDAAVGSFAVVRVIRLQPAAPFQ